MPLISTLECYRMLLDRLATARYTGIASAIIAVLPMNRDTVHGLGHQWPENGHAAINGHPAGRLRPPTRRTPAIDGRDCPHSLLKHHQPRLGGLACAPPRSQPARTALRGLARA
jgi:hypothetical protein